MWLPSINPTVVKTVEQAGYTVARVGRIVLGDYHPLCVQISARDYGQLQGGVWDFADGPLEEEDFNQLNRMVSV